MKIRLALIFIFVVPPATHLESTYRREAAHTLHCIRQSTPTLTTEGSPALPLSPTTEEVWHHPPQPLCVRTLSLAPAQVRPCV